jgi:hypothetical protein
MQPPELRILVTFAQTVCGGGGSSQRRMPKGRLPLVSCRNFKFAFLSQTFQGYHLTLIN